MRDKKSGLQQEEVVGALGAEDDLRLVGHHTGEHGLTLNQKLLRLEVCESEKRKKKGDEEGSIRLNR